MSWTAHDQLFGWVHSLRLNRNNVILCGRESLNQRPYPTIVSDPSFVQVLNNWNKADSGLVGLFFLTGLLWGQRLARKDIQLDSHVQKRSMYKVYHRVFIVFGIFFALRNSYYRLQGYVPNGLPKKSPQLVKYDYTSNLINNTFWRFFVQSHDKTPIQ